MRKAHLLTAMLLAGATVLCVSGCGKKEATNQPVVKMTVPKEQAKPVEPPKPVEAAKPKSEAAALYNPAGKRDPFVPFIKAEPQAARADYASLPPLQRYDLGELKFVGVIWGAKGNRALVEDAEGKGYSVLVGTKIGRGGGVVTKITSGEIFVREEFRDLSGSLVVRESSMKLLTSGGQ